MQTEYKFNDNIGISQKIYRINYNSKELKDEDDWLEALEVPKAPVYRLVFTDTKFHQLPVKKVITQ